jgi:hypothetical protein
MLVCVWYVSTLPVLSTSLCGVGIISGPENYNLATSPPRTKSRTKWSNFNAPPTPAPTHLPTSIMKISIDFWYAIPPPASNIHQNSSTFSLKVLAYIHISVWEDPPPYIPVQCIQVKLRMYEVHMFKHEYQMLNNFLCMLNMCVWWICFYVYRIYIYTYIYIYFYT